MSVPSGAVTSAGWHHGRLPDQGDRLCKPRGTQCCGLRFLGGMQTLVRLRDIAKVERGGGRQKKLALVQRPASAETLPTPKTAKAEMIAAWTPAAVAYLPLASAAMTHASMEQQ